MVTRKNLKLVHTSDTHLGGDWHPELSQNALKTVVQGVKRLEADALLIVGDVFDHARVSDGLLDFFLEQMALLKVPAVVLPGNHDIYDQESLYLRQPFRQAPANLHIFTQLEGQFISFPELTLDVWGRAMAMHTPEFRPLEGMTAAPNGNWLVALAHGHFYFDYDKETRSAPIYPEDVAQSPCDYLALGHWDRHVDVSQGRVKAVYSGAPLGAIQSNDSVAFTLVELDPEHGVDTRQVTLDMIA